MDTLHSGLEHINAALLARVFTVSLLKSGGILYSEKMSLEKSVVNEQLFTQVVFYGFNLAFIEGRF